LAAAYCLLTGLPQFEGEGWIWLMIAHARDLVVPLSRACSGIPEDLDPVMMLYQAEVPAERFPDAVSLEQGLSACACAGD
jgi:serine/threonine-protein kinase